MKKIGNSWKITAQQRPTDWDDDGRPIPGEVDVFVIITNTEGTVWELTLDSARSSLTYLGVRGVVNRESLRAIPVAHLIREAVGFLNELDHELGSSDGTENVTPVAEAIQAVSTVKGRPTPEVFAAAWHAVPEVSYGGHHGVEAIPRRQALADRFGVSLSSIDKWTRAARDAGLIKTKPKGGRPRLIGDTTTKENQ